VGLPGLMTRALGVVPSACVKVCVSQFLGSYTEKGGWGENGECTQVSSFDCQHREKGMRGEGEDRKA
jgi:hypothetical protein